MTYKAHFNNLPKGFFDVLEILSFRWTPKFFSIDNLQNALQQPPKWFLWQIWKNLIFNKLRKTFIDNIQNAFQQPPKWFLWWTWKNLIFRRTLKNFHQQPWKDFFSFSTNFKKHFFWKTQKNLFFGELRKTSIKKLGKTSFLFWQIWEILFFGELQKTSINEPRKTSFVFWKTPKNLHQWTWKNLELVFTKFTMVLDHWFQDQMWS